jgi:hypothetical protein
MEKAHGALPLNAGDDGSRLLPSRRKRLTSVALIALIAFLLMYYVTWGCSFGKALVPMSINHRVERILKHTPLIGIGQSFRLALKGSLLIETCT